MGILDLLFPKVCLGCGKEGVFLCPLCISKQTSAKNFCIECKRPSIDGITHSKCIRRSGLDGSISFWNYQGVIRKAISAFKYKFAYDIGNELAFYVISKMKTTFIAFGKEVVLVPVPLFPSRERWRGFNQAEIVGEILCRKLGWKYTNDLLLRTFYKTSQVGLRGVERARNVKDVFGINRKCNLKNSDSTFLIFDDVLITGSTLKEACKVLKEHGALKVWGMTIAS